MRAVNRPAPLTIADCAAAFAAGTPPSAILAHCLARADADDFGAFTWRDDTAARDAAAASDRRWADGRPLSLLDGVPIAVKANIAVAGQPWTGGLAAYRDRIAEIDAACVARLRAAGAILIAGTNMDEAALGALSDNPFFGRTENPRAPGQSAGGSSGGSAAAVAAGLCAAALGTDTLGSVRIPAAWCGVIGYKPRRGAIPLDGVVPLAPSLDHVGTLANSVADAALVADIIGGERRALAKGGAPPGLLPAQEHAWLAGRRIAAFIPPDSAPVDPAVAAAHTAAIDQARAAGAIVTPIALPDPARLARTLLAIATVEAADVHATLRRDRPETFSPAFARMLDWGDGVGRARIAAARADRAAALATITAALADVDALLLPAVPTVAPPHDAPGPVTSGLCASYAACTGWPSIAIPAGADPAGRPIGLEIMARDGRVALAIAAALA